MRLPWKKIDWLQYGTMWIRPEAIDCFRETGESSPAMEIILRSGTVILLGEQTAQKWAKWLARNGRKHTIAKWTEIPNHPNNKKIKVFISDNPGSATLK